jgi:recombination DNA repair RAD52 pathway protein
MKRALRLFGNRLGNCAYDKVFLKEVKGRPAGSTNNLVRPANYPEVKKLPIQPAHHPTHPVSNPQNQEIIFDDSVFDNSMMISEEDFFVDEAHIMVDEGHAGVANATFPSAASSGLYPLPPRRK